ncbi:MAG: ATP-dependent DNA helicase RecG [Chloroflexi bacterium]|nr:ATP-dependent DNA helicase RecG [Chloroflexota bacterium]
MSPGNAQALRKILEYEQKKGYADSTVIGGLDRFLQNWSGAALSSINSPALAGKLRRMTAAGYADMDCAQRQQWVEDMLALLDRLEADGDRPAPASSAVTKATVVAKATRQGWTAPTAGSLDAPVTAVAGISAALAARFAKLGVKTVRDLLYFFPHRHLDYSQVKSISQLEEGQEQTIIANVWQAQVVPLGGRKGTEAIVGDETGNVRVVWFNQPYLARTLSMNSRIVISGRPSLFRGRFVFESPEWEALEDGGLVHTARLVPVYSLTQGLRPRQVRKLMKAAVERWSGLAADFLPAGARKRHDLMELPLAIRQAHYPDDSAAKDRARTRLAFDELFLLQLGVMGRRRDWQQGQQGTPLDIDRPLLDAFLGSLPFRLTAAQDKVLSEIIGDLRKPQPMCRLLQGEVGSGKTVVATAALLLAAASGCQGALMAPTEILAEQHFSTINKLLAAMGQPSVDGQVRSYSGILPRPLRVVLLTGDVSQARKQEVKRGIASGEVDLVIGTHAIIQKEVEFHRLGLAVVDEQHRFGVGQRSALRQKGSNPHLLVMTATPIPRTLALTLYGDLDLSIIDELPPGRQPVKTKWVQPSQRYSAYNFIRRQVAAGRQAFVICPLVEESEAVAAQAAVAEHQRLCRDIFPDLRLGLLHGRMSSAEKDGVMNEFRSGTLDILVATPVIEVGIDVPNATVMMVESAERFGLSQLHQFRGRVGRGQEQSYCMLLSENPSEVGRQRLDIIERTQDGFALAEEDLRLRGPGEFFGTRQSGLPDLRMARLSDIALLEAARSEAVRLFEDDPGLQSPEHRLLAGELARAWPRAAEWS